jgi:hypothetical protein
MDFWIRTSVKLIELSPGFFITEGTIFYIVALMFLFIGLAMDFLAI